MRGMMARSTMDTQISTNLASMSLSPAVHAQRTENSRAPISHLPVELLTTIFVIVRDVALHEAKADVAVTLPKGFRAFNKWIRVAQVCQKWRTVAFGMSALWSHIQIDLTTYEGAKEMLSRSKPAPITVYFNKHTGPDSLQVAAFGFLNANVKDNMQRITELRLRKLTHEQLGKFFSQQLLAPQLLALHIVCKTGFSHRSLKPLFILHDGLMRAPSLKRLHIANVPVILDGTYLNRLAHLKLGLHRQNTKPTLPSLLRFLSQTSLLQSLTLSYAVDSNGIDQRDLHVYKQNKIDLNFLQSLQIKQEMGIFPDLLESIKIPSSCAVNLYSCCEFETGSIFNHLVQSISGLLRPCHLFSSTRPRIRCLRVFISGLDEFTIHGFYEPLSHSYINSTLNLHPPINLCFERSYFEDGAEVGEGILVSLLEILGLRDVVTLEVCGTSLSEEFWLSTFGSIPNLQSIHHRRSSEELFTALSALGSGGTPPFARLEEIILSDDETNIPLIAEALTVRKTHYNLPIKRLSLPTIPEVVDFCELLNTLGCQLDVFECNYWLLTDEVEDSDSEIERRFID